ncbi:hypothetical protein K440DRAFT_225222 [Wilcoxina mikolae CBS 423.85]|nr:hypothetical protein K440DRAFT_225222 [Wilcoxina mikolae CBS 423.85]
MIMQCFMVRLVGRAWMIDDGVLVLSTSSDPMVARGERLEKVECCGRTTQMTISSTELKKKKYCFEERFVLSRVESRMGCERPAMGESSLCGCCVLLTDDRECTNGVAGDFDEEKGLILCVLTTTKQRIVGETDILILETDHEMDRWTEEEGKRRSGEGEKGSLRRGGGRSQIKYRWVTDESSVLSFYRQQTRYISTPLRAFYFYPSDPTVFRNEVS